MEVFMHIQLSVYFMEVTFSRRADSSGKNSYTYTQTLKQKCYLYDRVYSAINRNLE